MINGRGAAHDADVLVEPPMQMPFTYPSRLNFECKAHRVKTSLTIVRNALGLRYDLNEFEITTRAQLKARQNNRRISIAIDDRQRFYYQIGVASIEPFTKPAIEFAANNKIPLICLRWVLGNSICDNFHRIDSIYLKSFESSVLTELIDFLKKGEKYSDIGNVVPEDTLFSQIIRAVVEFENRVYIGLLESGDLLLLTSNNAEARSFLRNKHQPMPVRIHYSLEEPNLWTLAVEDFTYSFRLPKSIMNLWNQQNLDRHAAIDMKAEKFSRVFVFIDDPNNPIRILTIDREWLGSLSHQN